MATVDLKEKAYNQAKEYYPKLWDKSRLEKLLEKKLLTQMQIDEITGIQ